MNNVSLLYDLSVACETIGSEREKKSEIGKKKQMAKFAVRLFRNKMHPPALPDVEISAVKKVYIVARVNMQGHL